MATPSESKSTTRVHVTALDGLVNVNSLFTFAVFVGLSLTTPGAQRSLEDRADCHADVGVARRLLVYEVFSFSFFLFSSLVAQGLKLAINLLNSKVELAAKADINKTGLRVGMLFSAFGSFMGCVFLILSMINVIQIRLGTLSCGCKSTILAVAVMVILVSSALLVYASTVIFTFKIKVDDVTDEEKPKPTPTP